MVKKKIKKSKGITLIALIITILISIILTTLVVKITVDKDFFGKTKQGVNATNNKVALHHNNMGQLMDEFDTLLPQDPDGKKPDDEVIEPEEIPQITFEYSPALDTWTNKDVTVTARANLSGYDIQISNDGTTWEPSNTIEYESNGKVYARAVKNGSQVGTTAEGEVTNIDKTPPTVGNIIAFDDDTTYEFDDENDLSVVVNGSIYVKKQDGSDSLSGHKSTTYAIYDDEDLTCNSMSMWEDEVPDPYNLIGVSSLTWDDIVYPGEDDVVTSRAMYASEYWIEVKTLDNAGNEAREVYYIWVQRTNQ